jgi:hypothetical protein
MALAEALDQNEIVNIFIYSASQSSDRIISIIGCSSTVKLGHQTKKSVKANKSSTFTPSQTKNPIS